MEQNLKILVVSLLVFFPTVSYGYSDDYADNLVKMHMREIEERERKAEEKKAEQRRREAEQRRRDPDGKIAGKNAACLLDNLPGTENDIAAYSIRDTCFNKYPSEFYYAAQGSGRGVFGYKSGDECTGKKAAKTHSKAAAKMIRYACNILYNKEVK
jgi:hypothetical protein